jgi:dTDP-4-amino-4,6-dideoxygalactose transaminase
VRNHRLEGVGTGYYRMPCHLQPAMREWGADVLELPGTREAALANVALPMGKDLTEDQIEEVVRACASGST